MNHIEKPFGCTFVGCNMSFTNEDHLVVHKTKHNMMLNLGNGKPSNFIDQTPTPTRFMRNCDEVGLFQDLQHVNPFEETFRKAVESGKLESLTVNDINDDTLHTPQVFSHMDDDKKINSSITINDSITFNNNNNNNNNVKEKNKSNIIITTESTISKNNTETIVIQEEKNLLVTAISSFNNDQGLDNEHVDDNHSQQELTSQNHDLLESYTNNKTNDILWSNSSIKTKLQLVNKNNNCYYKNIKDNENYSTKITTSSNNNNNQSNDVKKKLDILERNRASSMRSRAKRKAWIEQLETSMNKVNSINKELQNEVNSLRFEVANLKTLLLAHKNCPVTKALAAGNNPENSNIIPIITPITIINPSIDNTNKIIMTNQLPINSKRKKTILLPKINNSELLINKVIKKQNLNDIQQIVNEKTTSKKLYIIKKLTTDNNTNNQISNDHKNIPIVPK